MPKTLVVVTAVELPEGADEDSMATRIADAAMAAARRIGATEGTQAWGATDREHGLAAKRAMIQADRG